jgi:hypothetical protein
VEERTKIDQREEILPQNAGYCKSEYEMETNHLMLNQCGNTIIRLISHLHEDMLI